MARALGKGLLAPFHGADVGSPKTWVALRTIVQETRNAEDVASLEARQRLTTAVLAGEILTADQDHVEKRHRTALELQEAADRLRRPWYAPEAPDHKNEAREMFEQWQEAFGAWDDPETRARIARDVQALKTK